MSKQKYLVGTELVEVNGNTIEVNRIVADSYGNPRYVVHFRDLGLELSDYDSINKKYGFTKYRAKWFGGGIVFQSYNIEDTLKRAFDTIQEKKDSDTKFIKKLSKRYSYLMPH